MLALQLSWMRLSGWKRSGLGLLRRTSTRGGHGLRKGSTLHSSVHESMKKLLSRWAIVFPGPPAAEYH